jgi:protease IV
MKKIIFPFLILLNLQLFAQDNQDIIALFHLDKLYSEAHRPPGLEEILNEDKEPQTFMSLISRLRAASRDKNVKACLFYGNTIGLGLAQKEELNRHIKKLNDAGKETLFYAHNLSNSNFTVASTVKQNILFPEGEVMINGIYAQSMYFKGLLDKIGLEADVIHIGDYKSAGEPFYLKAPSQESKNQKRDLYHSIHQNTITDLAQNHKKKTHQIEDWIDQALFSSKEAQQKGMIDSLAYHKDMIASLREKYKAKITFTYGLPQKKPFKMNGIMDIFLLMQKLSQPPKKDTMDKVSLTVLEGAITMKMGEELRQHILSQALDPSVKAMVLRVNSPGGSAQASEIICQALIEFKNTKKPLIVSMGNIAASGGYYVAAPAELIYAEKSTITGSIGVVGGKLIFKNLLNNLGITTDSYKIGRHADLMSMTTKFSNSQRNLMLDAFERVYETFKNRIIAGRGNRIKGDLESLAGGRVYTGSQALELGLIDKIGGLRDALDTATSKANLDTYKISMFPKKITLMDLISKELREDKNEPYLQSGSQLKQLLQQPLLANQLKSLSALNPQLAKQVKSFIDHLQLFANEGVLLISPQFPY